MLVGWFYCDWSLFVEFVALFPYREKAESRFLRPAGWPFEGDPDGDTYVLIHFAWLSFRSCRSASSSSCCWTVNGLAASYVGIVVSLCSGVVGRCVGVGRVSAPVS